MNEHEQNALHETLVAEMAGAFSIHSIKELQQEVGDAIEFCVATRSDAAQRRIESHGDLDDWHRPTTEEVLRCVDAHVGQEVLDEHRDTITRMIDVWLWRSISAAEEVMFHDCCYYLRALAHRASS